MESEDENVAAIKGSAMVYCTECGFANEQGNAFCSQCGSPLEQPEANPLLLLNLPPGVLASITPKRRQTR